MNKTILIIEDDQNYLDILTPKLQANGYTNLIYALDGKEGLKTAKKIKPDLVILDLLLPNLDGFHICGYLKHDKRYKNILIIMLTGKADYKDLKLGKDIGADAYLIKGMNSDELLDTIDQLFKEKK